MIFAPEARWPWRTGTRIIPAVNAISPRFDKCVATQDWHPLGHGTVLREACRGVDVPEGSVKRAVGAMRNRGFAS